MTFERHGGILPRQRVRGRPCPRGPRAVVLFGLLALAFALMQQAASLHWLAHAIAAVQPAASPDAPDSGTGLAADHCDQCLLLAAFAAGAPAATGAAGLPTASGESPSVLAQPVRQRGPPALAFRSRAPPIPA